MEIPFEVHAAIHRQKARYGRYVDTKQWDKFHDIAISDARFSFHAIDGKVLFRNNRPLEFNSVDDFTTYQVKALASAQTLHMFGPGDLTFVSEARDEVSAIWSMEDELAYMGSDGDLTHRVRGGGFYYEIYKLDQGVWKIKSLKLVRTISKLQVPGKPVKYQQN